MVTLNQKKKKKSLIARLNSRNNIYIYIYSYYRFSFYFIFQFKTLTKSSHSRSKHLLYFSYFISNSKLNLNIKIKSLGTNDTLIWEKIQSLIKNFANRNVNLNSNLRAQLQWKDLIFWHLIKASTFFKLISRIQI